MERTKRKPDPIRIALIAIGAILLLIGAAILISSSSGGPRVYTKALVSSVSDDYSESEQQYVHTVLFAFNVGEEFTTATLRHAPTGLHVGESVGIFYLKNNPASVGIANNEQTLPIVFIAIGAALGLSAALIPAGKREE